MNSYSSRYLCVAVIAFGASVPIRASADQFPTGVTLIEEAIGTGCSPAEIVLRLEENSVYELQIESTVVSAETDSTVLQTESTAIGVTSTIDQDKLGADQAAADVVVAQKGDLIQVEWPHEACLANGLYGEQITIAVVTSDGVFDVSGTRYFEVSEKGVQSKSGEDYSKIALKFVVGPTGTMDIRGDGLPVAVVPESYMYATPVRSGFRPYNPAAAGAR